jgi:2-polyprenyl-6-methoxyphenol hydroxylase-like FAD-dependent oxidoreductase
MKIAICGAGIAGPTLAHFLLRAGHEPMLIEAAPAFRTGGYVVDFWGLGFTVAERMGVIDAVLERGYQAEEVRLVTRDGHAAGGFKADVFRRMTHDRFTSIPRGDLAEILFESVEDRVETRFGDSVAALHDIGDGMEVWLKSGESRAVDMVVGADGLHSRVRQLVWGDQAGFERPLGYHVAAFEAAGYPRRDDNVYVTHSEPGVSLARFSLRGDRTLFMMLFSDEHFGAATPEDAANQRALLHSVFGGAGWEAREMLDVLDRTGTFYFDRVSQIEMPEWSRGRVVLLGDAAACASLMAGEGTGLAMTEAYVLAGELGRSGGDVVAAARAYEARLRHFIGAKQKAARGLAGSMIPETAFGVWIQRIATRAMVLPPVADFFIGDSLRDDFVLPDYEF